MRVAIVGLGVQGRKRLRIAGDDVVATVDPAAGGASYRSIAEVPLDAYDAACVCTPDEAKPAIVEHLLANRKHVLVEKPLLVGERTLRRFAEYSRATGTACYTAYNHRFEPHLVTLKALVADGRLGEPYLLRMFYGNGTARDVRLSPWRDQGWGVLADLGSHLLDLVLFLLGPIVRTFAAWSIGAQENRAPDHAVFGASGRPALVLEATLLSWRNTFTLDYVGERGSAHIDGLCKWGPSAITVRRRVLPSGRPEEERVVVHEPDPTWMAEYEYFTRLAAVGGHNLDNDSWIAAALKAVAREAGVARSA
jgi:predicted dehydrogenase